MLPGFQCICTWVFCRTLKQNLPKADFYSSADTHTLCYPVPSLLKLPKTFTKEPLCTWNQHIVILTCAVRGCANLPSFSFLVSPKVLTLDPVTLFLDSDKIFLTYWITSRPTSSSHKNNRKRQNWAHHFHNQKDSVYTRKLTQHAHWICNVCVTRCIQNISDICVSWFKQNVHLYISFDIYGSKELITCIQIIKYLLIYVNYSEVFF